MTEHSLRWAQQMYVIQQKQCKKGLCICLCCVLLESCVCIATHPARAEEVQSSASVTPPQIQTYIQPAYPQNVPQKQESIQVRVLLEINEQGHVTRASFVEGPQAFKESSLNTAMQLVFSPAMQDGIPVSTKTTFTFIFSPAPNEVPLDDNVKEIIIHSSDPDKEDTRTRKTLDKEELERSMGDDLATTISSVAGVRMAGGTTDAAKPIIRGQQERRLLILHSGVRHESQKWGPDHATEIDPFSAGSISVIRGAAGARYGPDAIGGVILVEPPAMKFDQGTSGKARTSYNTNGRRGYGAFRIDSGYGNGFSTRIEGNFGKGASLDAPRYVLGNTGSSIWNLGTTVAYQWGGGTLTASWHHYDFKAGIFYGINHPTPTEFLAQLEQDKPVTADLWSVSYDIDRPFQAVTHDTALLKSSIFGDWGTLNTTYAFQINLRQEYERAREDITGPQFDFTLRTHSIDSVYQHPTIYQENSDLTGEVGLQGSFQENVYRGLPLIPNYRRFSGGVFAYERLALERLDFEIGMRADAVSQAAYLGERDYEAHVRRGTIDESNCEERDETNRCPAQYSGASISVGTLVHVVPEKADIKLNLSTANRFPNIDELYMLGSAPSFPVYALGYPNLGKETVFDGSFTFGLRHDIIEAEVAAYGQLIDDYIYFSPELNDEGVPRFDVTIRGTWPRWSYQPIDALFYGMEAYINLAPKSTFGFTAKGDIVRAQHRETMNQLVGTPADRIHLTAIARPPVPESFEKLEFRFTTELVGKQTRVNPEHDIAPPPDGYMLLGGSIDATFGKSRTYVLGIEARNLLNTSYRDYTSLLRYYANQPGRDIRIRLGTDF